MANTDTHNHMRTYGTLCVFAGYLTQRQRRRQRAITYYGTQHLTHTHTHKYSLNRLRIRFSANRSPRSPPGRLLLLRLYIYLFAVLCWLLVFVAYGLTSPHVEYGCTRDSWSKYRVVRIKVRIKATTTTTIHEPAPAGQCNPFSKNSADQSWTDGFVVDNIFLSLLLFGPFRECKRWPRSLNSVRLLGECLR